MSLIKESIRFIVLALCAVCALTLTAQAQDYVAAILSSRAACCAPIAS